jgi:PKD repeat protein
LGGANKALISDNKISNITYGATYNAATGIYISGSTSQGFVTNTKIQRNTISKLTGLVLYAGANGIAIYQSGGVALNDTISNNFITDLRNTAGYGSVYPLYNTFAITTFYGSGFHIYNNSINLFGDYLNTSVATAATFSAGFLNYYGEQINFKNNLIVNKLFPKNATAQPLSASVGAWFYSAGSTTGAGSPYVASLDNNNYDVSGNPIGFPAGAGGIVYGDLVSWQLGTNKDKNSFADVALFVDSLNLHINSGSTGTLLESHGQNIVGLNRDIDNDLRPGPVGSIRGGAKAYDIGADEFDGVYLADIFAPTILTDSISPAVNACSQQAHTFYLKVLDMSGVDTAQMLYTVNGVLKTPFMMTKTDSIRYRGTIPAVGPGLQVKVYIYAKDSIGNKTTKLLSTYTDAKFNFTVVSSADTIAVGSTVGLNAIMPNTAINMGGTSVISSTGYPSPYNTSWWGNKEQYLFTAAELTAKGFVAGKITELGLLVGTVTTTLPLTNFTISMGHTTNTALSTFITAGMSNVYMNPSYVVLPNQINTHTFQTPFIWDGVSNVVIETCFNNSAYNGSQTITYTTTTNVSCIYSYADAATVCSSPGTVYTSSNRPNFIISQPLTATYSWTSSTNGGLQSTNIINPDAIPTGTPGVYSYVLAATSGGCTWTDTVDVRVITAVTPSAGFRTDTIAGVAGAKPTTIKVLNSAANYPNTWNYTVTPNTYIFVNNTTATSKAPNLQFTRAGVYSIKQKVQNAAGVDSLTRTNYITITLKYCDAGVSYSGYNYVSSVGLTSMNVGSGLTALPSYNNYTDSSSILPASLIAGRSDTVKVKLAAGSYGWASSNATAAWIDYNRNGQFENSEKLGEIAISAAGVTGNLIFKVPYTAESGITRMRVRTDSYNSGGVKACGSSNYGEIEDYAVNIAAAPAMVLNNIKVEQDTVAVLPATTNAVVVRTKVIVTGYTNRLSLTSLSLSTAGTTSLSDITNVKVYYTANKDTFNTNTLFGSGTPAATLTINGSALLEGDTNYFWVAYDVASAAVVGNAMDAAITSMVIGGTSTTPSISSPAGVKYILLQAVPTNVNVYEPFGAIPVYNATKGNPILAAKISMTNGVISQMNELKFKLSSTTKYQNIDKLYLVYTKGDSTYRSSYKEQFGQVPGSTLGTLTFTDTINLVAGNNYFWLVADATSSASVGDTLDGSFLSAKLAGRTVDTSIVKTTSSLRKFAPFPISGCTSAATSTADEDIGFVQVGSFTNKSAASLVTNNNPDAVNLYSNFGSLQGLTMQVEVPIDYKVNVINFGGSLYTTTVNIFVDLNQNGTFDLPRERVAKKLLTNSSADRVAIGSIKLPIGTKGGNAVMRVVATETSNTNDTLPACATYTWGETEDYIVNVLPAPPGDYYAPIISSIALTPDSSCVAIAHTISATIKDTTGVDSVWINWTKDGIAQTAIVMTHVGDLYSGTIPAQGLSAIRFSLRAQDNSPRANENISKSDVYRDEYLKAALNAGPDGYVAAGGSYQIDAAVKREPIFGTAQYNTMVYGFYRYYGAMKYQEIITAAELQAKGLTAGVINTIAWNTTGTQSTDTMLDFTVSMGNTSQADLVAGYITSGLTQVIDPRKFVPVAGGYAKSAVPFNTNFVWDGISNIVVSWCWSNNDGGTASSSTNPYVYYTTTGNPTGIARYYYLDNVASSTACAWSTEGYSTTARTDIMLKQSLPYTYNWTQSTNGGLSALNIPNPIATPTGGVGAYQYIVTVGDGTCTAMDTVMVNVLPLPTVDLGTATGLICGTTPRVLDAGNPDAASYAWYINNAIDPNTTRTMLASTAGMYKVVVRDRAGQTAVDSINLTVGAAFTYNIGADTLGLCLGGTRTLDPGTYPSYLWSTGATTRTLAVSTTGVYSLTVTNAGGCIASDTFRVVSVAPTTVSLGADQAICTSAPLTLDAGNTGATYLWSTGATTQTIQAKFAGNYSVIVNTVTGCTLYDTIVITNLPAPSVTIGPDFQLCPGSTSVLDAGNAGNTFLWSTGATTQTLTISSAGTYYVTVTGANGCSTNDTIIVTPKTAPVVSLGADQNICTSDTVTLDAGNAGATYLWSTGATTQTIRVSLANTYSVAVTNVGGCTTNDAVVITNKAVPVSSFTTQVVDTTKGQQVKFTAVAAAGTSYAWNFGDPTSASNTSSLSSPTHLFSAPGNYTVTLTVTNVATGCKSVTQTAVSVTGFANDFAKAFKLVAAPNPFAGNTKINYELPSNANVTLEVYDMIGRKVSTIANAAYQESGVHTYDFSAGDNQNASGVYMVRLIVDGQVAILRVIDIANR